MKNNHGFTALDLVVQALVAALYIVLTWSVPAFSYGIVQFRISEVLTLLAFYNPKYVYGLTIACVIANILSPFGIWDVIFGSLASFFALVLMSKINNIYLASLMPALSAPIIGIGIYLGSGVGILFITESLKIALSELIIVTFIGIPLFKILMKENRIREFILKDSTKRNKLDISSVL